MAAAVVVALLVVVWVTLHSAFVQRPLAERILESVEASTGWRVEIAEPRLRLFPAHLVATGITVSAGERVVASVDRLEASWQWSELLGSPPRLDSVAANGVTVDLRDLQLPEAPEPAPDAGPVNPWRVVEVGRLSLSGGSAEASVPEVAGTLEEVTAAASLVDGAAALEAGAGRLVLVRQGRSLELGPVAMHAEASAEGVVVKRLTVDGADASVEASGSFGLAEGLDGEVELQSRTDLEAVLGWWDPNLVSGLEPSGTLALAGRVAVDPAAGLRAELVHRGAPFRVAGYELDSLELGLADGTPSAHLGGGSWGEATVSTAGAGVVAVTARLDRAPVERALAFAAPQVAAAVPGPIRVTGTVDGTVPFPVMLEGLGGTVDLTVTASLGRAELAASGAGDRWRLQRARVETPGVVVEATGSVGPAGALDLGIDLKVEDVETAIEGLRPWTTAFADLEPGGGPVTAHAVVTGLVSSPRFDVEAASMTPTLMGRGVDRLSVDAEGGPERATWSLDVAVAPGIEAKARGTADLATLATSGDWELRAEEVDRLGELAGLDPALLATFGGGLDGAGEFSWDGSRWTVDGELRGSDLEAAGWRVDSIGTRFTVDPDSAALENLTIELLGGTVAGSVRVGLEGLDAPVTASLKWQDLDLKTAPLEVGAAAEGRILGELTVSGTVRRPVAVVDATWTPDDPASLVPAIHAGGALEDGVLRLVSGDIDTGAGLAVAEVRAPLGVLPKPEWLWPEAPVEAVRVSVRGHAFRSEPLVAMLGLEPLPAHASGDLTIDATWHPTDRSQTKGMIELDNLVISHVGGEVTSKDPVLFTFSESAVELAPVTLIGPRSEIRMAGSRNLGTGRLEGRLDATVAPSIAQLIPYPLQVYRPIQLSAQLRGAPESPVVDIQVRHENGALVLRDPPLEIRDLVLSARWQDGALRVRDGRATVNEGTVEIGGGWDPVSRQGLVAEIDNVVLYLEGILSQWSGVIAIEPDPPRLATVTGELNLVAGLWDENVSLTGALFGPESLEPAPDDPLYRIGLNLDIRGRGKVRVENNLGRFDARWDVLRVSGTAARPRLHGEITIDPGGRFSLAGQNLKVRRGSLLFTGDPAVDPIVEIVPEDEVMAFGGEEGSINTTTLATQGLVQGVAGALGFENETLQPATISVETEKDSSDNIMLGQRISHNLALFFATSATNVQDQTSMLQLWNISGLKGLAIQAYQKTLTEESGGNLFQRFRWGGTSRWDDRPTVRKLRLEGEWPIGKRRLRRSTGLRRGQPFEPFLLFVAKVRMERELAGEGFQTADVSADIEASDLARTLVFTCDPGPRQTVSFTGDMPPERVRREVTALYQGPPLERVGFANMEALLERHYDAEGFPEVEVEVARVDDEVVATIRRGGAIELVGPILAGVPEDVERAVVARLGSPADLASLMEDEERAARVIGGVLAEQGYHHAVVEQVGAVAVSGSRTELRADVELGPRATVGEVVLRGTDPLGLLEADDFPLTEGVTMTQSAVDLAASRLRTGYDAAGYSDAQVRGFAEPAEDDRWTVVFQIEPGLRRTIEGAVVTGLRYTSERSVLAGVTLENGEILRNSDLDAIAVRVANFAPIERVDVLTVPVGATGARVELDIEEKPRWTAEVGGGWSTERGAQARFGLRDDNMFGRGFGLNLRGRWDSTEWLGFIVASLPPLPGKRLSFSSTVGYSSGDAPTNPDLLNQDELFWSFETTRMFGIGRDVATDAGTLYYRFSSTHTFEKAPSFFPIDTTVKVGLLGARYVRDRFDNPLDPRSGYGFSLDGGLSRDILGSELDYWTFLGRGSIVIRALGSSTWVHALRAGIAEPIGGTVLTKEAKFFAGGQGSIRGFDRDTVGPTQISLGGFAPAGGGALFILNEELRVPVWRELRGAVFVDAGQVWESWSDVDGNLAVGAGVGFRWSTPIGPLWGDVAWPVANRGISSTGPKFYLGIGRPF